MVWNTLSDGDDQRVGGEMSIFVDAGSLDMSELVGKTISSIENLDMIVNIRFTNGTHLYLTADSGKAQAHISRICPKANSDFTCFKGEGHDGDCLNRFGEDFSPFWEND